MNKTKKLAIIFTVSFIVGYLIVGYIINTMFVEIDWVENVTIWHKLKEYYIRTFFQNIIPALIIAGISTVIFNLIGKKE